MRYSSKRGEKVAGRVNFSFSFSFFLSFPSRDDPMRGGGVIRKRETTHADVHLLLLMRIQCHFDLRGGRVESVRASCRWMVIKRERLLLGLIVSWLLVALVFRCERISVVSGRWEGIRERF